VLRPPNASVDTVVAETAGANQHEERIELAEPSLSLSLEAALFLVAGVRLDSEHGDELETAPHSWNYVRHGPSYRKRRATERLFNALAGALTRGDCFARTVVVFVNQLRAAIC